MVVLDQAHQCWEPQVDMLIFILQRETVKHLQYEVLVRSDFQRNGVGLQRAHHYRHILVNLAESLLRIRGDVVDLGLVFDELVLRAVLMREMSVAVARRQQIFLRMCRLIQLVEHAELFDLLRMEYFLQNVVRRYLVLRLLVGLRAQVLKVLVPCQRAGLVSCGRRLSVQYVAFNEVDALGEYL